MSRYQRAVEIEDLIVTLAESRRGLTIADICERYAVSRRTAERMRDAVAERFPLAEGERLDGDRRKRWRINGRLPAVLAQGGAPGGFTADELAVLERAAEALAEAERPDLTQALVHIVARSRGASGAGALTAGPSRKTNSKPPR